jgi:hypothetical protein
MKTYIILARSRADNSGSETNGIRIRINNDEPQVYIEEYPASPLGGGRCHSRN